LYGEDFRENRWKFELHIKLWLYRTNRKSSKIQPTKIRCWVHPRTGHEGPEGGVEVYLYSFFNLEATWGWVVNATPRPLYPRERPGTHSTGGWVGPRAGLEGCRKSHHHRDSIHGPSSP
jgi:hypothetical protein